MEIKWKELKSEEYPLDYFAVTIKNGNKEIEKAYYINYSDNILYVNNNGLDYLLKSNFIKCFSFGIDEKNGKKFDFTVCTQDYDIIFETLSKSYRYFDYGRLKILLDCLRAHSLNYVHHVLGTKKYIQDDKVTFGNICLYFRMDAGVNYFRAKEFISDITKLFSLNDNDTIYPSGKNSWLHMVALDFSEDEFKLKFYFEFNKNNDPKDLLKCFDKTENYELALDLVNSNGYIEMLQIALSSKKHISYNFYFKQR